MDFRLIKGYEADRLLQANEGEWLASGFNDWFGYVEGRGLIRDRRGVVAHYPSKRIARDVFELSKKFYFKAGRNTLVEIDNI